MTALTRAAVPTDAAEVLDLIHQHAAFEHTTAVVSEADLVGILAVGNPPARLLVAEGQRGLEGYAALTFDYAMEVAVQAGVRRVEWRTPVGNDDAVPALERVFSRAASPVRR